MNFKNRENGLMWESFNSPNEFEKIENHDDDNDVKDVVMSFDTSEPVESEIEHDESENSDHERNEMVKSEIKKLSEFAHRLEEMAHESNFEEWMVAKITKAADYTSDVYFRLSSKVDYANSGCSETGEY